MRAASETSAPGRMMHAFLPPSSSVTRCIVAAAPRAMAAPAAGEPVKETLATPAWRASAAPVARSPGSTPTTPGGRPASTARAPRCSALSGVCSAGLMTTVQPAASAGASLATAESSGKLKGRIAATTPIGSACVKARPPAAAPATGSAEPEILSHQPAK